ncbi:hypothetical protein ACH5RR_039494 [Cinchona calisaya]|uniref:RNase H type-1 domain-containing protein n=1 Tax=Cinchona calisaya TaxID=153742 RepID=A0ABD2Y052_9GENT
MAEIGMFEIHIVATSTTWSVKINFDAAIFKDLACSGTRVVMRYHVGKFIAGCAEKFVNIVTPELGEMLAARRAVEYAVEVGVSRFWMEDDTKIGISQLQAHEAYWVDRDRNKLAHSFAKLAKLYDGLMLLVNTTHLSVQSVYEAELS